MIRPSLFRAPQGGEVNALVEFQAMLEACRATGQPFQVPEDETYLFDAIDDQMLDYFDGMRGQIAGKLIVRKGHGHGALFHAPKPRGQFTRRVRDIEIECVGNGGITFHPDPMGTSRVGWFAAYMDDSRFINPQAFAGWAPQSTTGAAWNGFGFWGRESTNIAIEGGNIDMLTGQSGGDRSHWTRNNRGTRWRGGRGRTKDDGISLTAEIKAHIGSVIEDMLFEDQEIEVDGHSLTKLFATVPATIRDVTFQNLRGVLRADPRGDGCCHIIKACEGATITGVSYIGGQSIVALMRDPHFHAPVWDIENAEVTIDGHHAEYYARSLIRARRSKVTLRGVTSRFIGELNGDFMARRMPIIDADADSVIVIEPDCDLAPAYAGQEMVSGMRAIT
jgi:hypothetical protein